MEYITKEFEANLGFKVTTEQILKATNELNDFLQTLPPHLYKSLDFKTTGAMVGAIFCAQLANNIEGAIVNPIEKGYPDIIPSSGATASEEQLRNYPYGLEVKGTVGNLPTGTKLKGGQQRIGVLSTVTWQAHHREVNNVLCIVWDFCNEKDGFMYPALTAAFFSSELSASDWGEISGTTGRNTKVCGMKECGKTKMGKGLILIYNSEDYINKYSKILKINDEIQTS
ncbi:MAG: hypothetical protein E7097_08505 [Bacteroides sp.]|nr:hypothetical protein [Bacteroides sp.]